MTNWQTIMDPFSGLSHRFYHVWQRNRDTLLRLWKTELWPPFIEPALYLVALGYGLGQFVPPIQGMSYLQFIAPGFIITSCMWSSSFECLWGTFIRMEHQRTFDATIATPVSVEDVIAGEIFWGMTRAVLSCIAVFIIVALFGLLSLPSALGILPVAALAGFVFASVAFAYTSVAPSIDFFNYFITLVLTPMFLFSGVFYPISTLPDWAQRISWFLPLTHAVAPARMLATGRIDASIIGDLVWLAVMGIIAFYASLVLMRRRLIR